MSLDGLSERFEQAKGKLRMPLDASATIVGNFGRSTHSEYSKVEIQNNGIDFQSAPGASAVAVFDGVVTMVIRMDGFQNVVLLRHGDYLTVYAGIDTLNVRKGQTVAKGQKLGTLHSNDGGRSTKLHFEVRHEKEKLNPAHWLK